MDTENNTYIKSLFLEHGEKLKFNMGQSLCDDNYLSGSVYYIENGSARVIYKVEIFIFWIESSNLVFFFF